MIGANLLASRNKAVWKILKTTVNTDQAITSVFEIAVYPWMLYMMILASSEPERVSIHDRSIRRI